MRAKKDIDESPTYDYDEAVVRYVLSNLLDLSKNEWVPCLPDYTIMRKRNDIKDKSIKKMFSHLETPSLV